MIVVAGKRGVVGNVFGGVNAGEGLEIADEVGLIEVAAVKGNAGPDNGSTG